MILLNMHYILSLICNETGYVAGEVVGMFGQAELYENHIDGAKELLKRKIEKNPTLRLDRNARLDNFNYFDAQLVDYKPGKSLYFKISV